MLLIQDKVLISKESGFVFLEETHEFRDSPNETAGTKRRRPRRSDEVASFSGGNIPATGNHLTARLFASPKPALFSELCHIIPVSLNRTLAA
jgi:hypothetical protein